jgi:hypothetical protein
MFDFLAALGLEPLTWEKLLATGSSTFWVGQAVTGPAFSFPTMR